MISLEKIFPKDQTVYMKIGKHCKKMVFAIFRTLFLVAVGYIILFPLFYMVSNAFKPTDQITDPTVVWFPKSLTLENFKIATEAMHYGSALISTLTVDIVSAIIQVFTCAIVAYGFARFEFKEKNFVFGLVILTMILPQQAILVPLYSNYTNLDFFYILHGLRKIFPMIPKINLINSPLTFYLPALLGAGLRSGFFIFIYRQFFKGLPKELEEAAWIDGAGPFKTFVKIVLPSSGVAVLTVFIFSIIWYWNEYMLSSLFFNQNQPLAVALSQIRAGLKLTTGVAATSNPVLIRNWLMAGSLAFIAPVLGMYLIVQKFFIQSIERVGIVG